MNKRIVFLGSSGVIQIPSFFCTCQNCKRARENLSQRRTRASLALLGLENTIIDVSPDIAMQLEREKIRTIHNIFITHWHFDHVYSLSELNETSIAGRFAPFNLYIHKDLIGILNDMYFWMKNVLNAIPVEPGDVIDIKDSKVEVVKTCHTENSIGYVFGTDTSFCYLGDGIEPEKNTFDRIKNCDILISEALMDELLLTPGEPKWYHFSVEEAIQFWRKTSIPKCILTHLSCHSWKNKRICEGFTSNKRKEIEKNNDELKFAYDGLSIEV